MDNTTNVHSTNPHNLSLILHAFREVVAMIDLVIPEML